jgi:hypothetical protein
MSFSRRVLHMDPCPWPALMHIADATGYPLTHPYVLGQDTTPSTSGDLFRAPRVPVATGTHGEPRTTTVRISLTAHQNTSLLTRGDCPLLCKAGVEVWSPFASRRGWAGSGVSVRLLTCVGIQTVEFVGVDALHDPRREQALEEPADPCSALPSGGDAHP